MKKNSLSFKKFSMKMRMFYFCLFSILVLMAGNLFIMKSENVLIAGIWGIVTLCGIATTGKAVDDWQRGLNFKPDLMNGGKGE